ncbi:MAG: hypothetical protein J0I41_24395 [Filimonas sp.]|nr:hypothetical protein [Filimonas sp.]
MKRFLFCLFLLAGYVANAQYLPLNEAYNGNVNSSSLNFAGKLFNAQNAIDNYGPFLSFGAADWLLQFNATTQANSDIYTRVNGYGGLGTWYKLWHSGNFNPAGYFKFGSNPYIAENGTNFLEGGSYNGYTYLQSHGSQSLHLNPLGNHVLIPSGNVAIGTTIPSVFKLLIDNGATRNGLRIESDGDGSAYSDINFAVKNPDNIVGAPTIWNVSHRKDGFFTAMPGMSSLEFYAELKGGGYYAPLCFKPNGDVILASPKNTSSSGNVSIGTTDSKGYKLAVNGAIRTKKVVVTQTDWPDYVFDSSYQLPSLDSVSSFIQVNKHLPDMPSAATVEKDGHDLGEVQKLLLKKMEEMTLYMIEIKKENAAMKIEIQKIKRQK